MFTSRPLTRREGLYLIALCLLLVLHGVVWKLTADTMRDMFQTWAHDERQAGTSITYSQPVVHGFPFRIDMELGDVHLERPKEFLANISNMHIRVRPWLPFRPVISGSQKSFFTLYEKNESYALDRFRIRIIKPWFAPRKSSDVALYVYGDFYGIALDPQLQSGLPNTVQSLSFHAKVRSSIPDFTSLQSLDIWRAGGGTIDLDRISAQWNPMAMKAEGTLTLDKDLQPLGTFSTKLSGYMQAVDRLVEKGELKPFAAGLFRAALRLLEGGQPADDSTRAIKVPITIKDSMISVAGIKVMRWGKAVLPTTPEEPQAASPADLRDDDEEAPPVAEAPPTTETPPAAITPPSSAPAQ